MNAETVHLIVRALYMAKETTPQLDMQQAERIVNVMENFSGESPIPVFLWRDNDPAPVSTRR
ncbi:MAG: hypothetical protein WA618_15235 [Terriglobales bacterium]